LVLVNGEFGARLARQARGWGLDARALEFEWGRPWELNQVEDSLDGARWIWAVHLETSTGMLNDIYGLADIADAHGANLCLDCVSSLGSVDLDLRRVWLASGVSGKSLGSYAGVAMVFAQKGALRKRTVPACLDVYEAARETGPRFTFPSPSLAALERALDMKRSYAELGCAVRRRLRAMGWQPLVEDSLAAPVVTTFREPAPRFLDSCRAIGFEIAGDSGYLRERGWVQIATMGAVTEAHIHRLFDGLECSKSLRVGC
jgi:aspartate aminotransferase-like enzyme